MEKRNAYMEKLEANLAEFNTKLDETKAKTSEAQDDMKAEYHSQVKKLETKRDDFVNWELKKSRGQAWDDLKVGTEKTWVELKGLLKRK